MKSWILPLSVALAAFASGLACALLLSSKLESRAWQEFEAFRDSPRFEAENSIRLHLINIEKAQRGDTNTVIRINCHLMRSNLRLVEPDVYENPEKRKEVKALVTRAENAIIALDKIGTCQP